MLAVAMGVRAYALMQLPADLEETYRGSPLYERASVQIERIRATLPVAPAAYRGIGRYPLAENSQVGPGWQGKRTARSDAEDEARALLAVALGPDNHETPSPRALLEGSKHAWKVHAALRNKSRYEVVELCTEPDQPAALLGFDVGYWGGGNFSIVCDAAVWPLWHAPTPEALPDLARSLQHLNKHGLFPSAKAARAYRAWYVQQPWAEDEPSEFVAVGVGLA